jgi:hypothetical protein
MVSLLYSPRQEPTSAKPDRRVASGPVDISKQKNWHETYRDLQRNQYRTTYYDMILNREVAVKSTKPSGYGGHVANVGADVLFNNTAFAQMQQDLKEDEYRERLPDFDYQLSGLPVHTANPRGSKLYKTAKTLPKGRVIPPWAVDGAENPLSYRVDMTGLLQKLAAPRYVTYSTQPTAASRQPTEVEPAPVLDNPAPERRKAVMEEKAQELADTGVTRTFTPRVKRRSEKAAEDLEPALEDSAARAHYVATSKASYVLNDGSRTPRDAARSASGAMTAR